MAVRRVAVRRVAVLRIVAVRIVAMSSVAVEEELTAMAIAGHMLDGVQCANVVVAGLRAGQHGARERRRLH